METVIKEQDKIPHSKVYTKKGDNGQSSLANGERKSKDDLVFEALGTIDELNAHIGLVIECIKQEVTTNYSKEKIVLSTILIKQLEEIQCLLFSIGADLASFKETLFTDDEHTKKLESWIDSFDHELPPLKNFILPSGGLPSCQLHICRSVCRRAERIIVSLNSIHSVSPKILCYVNRLSDYLFVAARYMAIKINENKETIWRR